MTLSYHNPERTREERIDLSCEEIWADDGLLEEICDGEITLPAQLFEHLIRLRHLERWTKTPPAVLENERAEIIKILDWVVDQRVVDYVSDTIDTPECEEPLDLRHVATGGRF